MRRSIVVLGVATAVVSVGLMSGSSAAATPRMSPSTLTKCGFTVQPNLQYWSGGSASLTPTGRIPAGRNTIIQGRAAQGLKDGTRLELLRFNPAGKGCHGSLDRIGGGIFTTVRGGQYYLNFQLDRQGSFGYAVQGISGGSTYEVEFQITTR